MAAPSKAPSHSAAPETDLGRITQSTVRDTPAATDALGFTPYVEAIAAFLDAPGTQPPFTLSIEGEWGCGKSSFMRQLEAALSRPPSQPGASPSIPVSFNAWRFDKQDALWAAFALAVTRELRHKSTWPRRMLGATHLFIARVDGPAAWLRLLQFLALWALVLSASIFGVWYLALDPALQQHALSLIFPAKVDEGQIPPLYLNLLSSGAWAGAVGVLAAALARSGAWLKSHLFDIKLERFINQPDYANHSTFIEEFHRDFAATIRAYAGNRKVYVFIDDLDRCDLLKAAELMQAINLMIGDDDHLVFILGIDRDKIAAGIAAKYKDVLPYLINHADTAPISYEERLAFGHQYLEKFIQLSFRIPLPDQRSVLQHFVERLTPAAAPVAVPQPSRLRALLAALPFLRRSAASSPTAAPSESPAPGTPREFADRVHAATTAQSAPTRTFVRIESGKDSQRIIDVVLMVSQLFGNNPRRLKQFLNTYRLSLYLSSAQGLLDLTSERPPLNLEQLGKLVALLMHLPRLSHTLLEDPGFLARYELYFDPEVENPMENNDPIPPPPAWFSTPEVRTLLRYRINSDAINRHTLRTFDVTTILRILPAVPRPSDTMLQILKGLNIAIPPSSEVEMENFVRGDGLAFSEIRINGAVIATVDSSGRPIAPQPTRGFSTAPPSSRAPATPPVPASTVPDRPEDDPPRPAPPSGPFSIILTHAGQNKIETLKALRRISDLSLEEAKRLVDTVPAPLYKNVSMEFAMRVGSQLDGIATVQLVGGDGSSGVPASAPSSTAQSQATSGSIPADSAEIAATPDTIREPAPLNMLPPEWSHPQIKQ